MSWSQTNIFDVIPDTQRQAWEDIQDKLSEKYKAVMTVISKGPAAGFEVAMALGWQLYRTLPRIAELRDMDLLVDSGERRVNPDSGKKTIVWRAR